MENGVTPQKKSASSTAIRHANCSNAVSITTLLLLTSLCATAGLHAIANYNWLFSSAAAMILLSSIFVCARAQRRKNGLTDHTYQHHDKLADQVAWSAMQPQITGESRNCMISPCSSPSYLRFAPNLSLHYAALIVATVTVTFALSISLSGTLPFFLTNKPIAVIDPELKTFIYMFTAVVLCYVALLNHKPVRSLVFNKEMGVFWIEKQRVFGWKAAESAQMPLTQIHALQIISYRKSGSLRHAAKEYEVNVVFRNTARVNIINHRNASALRHDTDALASFLNVPVWDRAAAP